jgi:hypothetical protein
LSRLVNNLEKILAKIDILGSSISFAFTLPPNKPTRRAILPAIVRTNCGVILFSLLSILPSQQQQCRPGKKYSGVLLMVNS